jgi:hypothetical protein
MEKPLTFVYHTMRAVEKTHGGKRGCDGRNPKMRVVREAVSYEISIKGKSQNPTLSVLGLPMPKPILTYSHIK